MSPPPRRYFAACHKGLEEVTAAELRAPAIDASAVRVASSGVRFEGDRAACYRANLWLRSAIRVHEELASGPAPDTDALYHWARSIAWPSLMSLDQTFAVDARVWDSAITHSKYAALRVKDAICDRFRADTGRRPSVDVAEPDLPLYLYVHRNEATLYRDTSGLTLHKRGYRDVMHRTSLNEALAAALVLRTGYDGSKVLADPMCGAGTFAIEAAMIALRRAPGLLRKRFAFERWPDFDAAAWRQAKRTAEQAAQSGSSQPPFWPTIGTRVPSRWRERTPKLPGWRSSSASRTAMWPRSCHRPNRAPSWSIHRGVLASTAPKCRALGAA